MALFDTVNCTADGTRMVDAPVRRIRERSEFAAAKHHVRMDSTMALRFEGATEVDGGTVITWTPFLVGSFSIHTLVTEVAETYAEFAAKLRHELANLTIGEL